MTSFQNLDDFVAIPRVAALRLAPDGSWLAAAVQNVSGEPAKYVTSIWRIPTDGGGRPVRLTRSAEGEGGPEFLPDGSLLFASKRPGPPPGPGDGDEDQAPDQPALWLLPAAGGEALRIAAPPGGVTGIAAASGAGTVILASPALAGTSGTDEDVKRRKARKDAGVTAILHESGPLRYWDHDLGPDSPRLFATEVSVAGRDRHAVPRPHPGSGPGAGRVLVRSRPGRLAGRHQLDGLGQDRLPERRAPRHRHGNRGPAGPAVRARLRLRGPAHLTRRPAGRLQAGRAQQL